MLNSLLLAVILIYNEFDTGGNFDGMEREFEFSGFIMNVLFHNGGLWGDLWRKSRNCWKRRLLNNFNLKN